VDTTKWSGGVLTLFFANNMHIRCLDDNWNKYAEEIDGMIKCIPRNNNNNNNNNNNIKYNMNFIQERIREHNFLYDNNNTPRQVRFGWCKLNSKKSMNKRHSEIL
jgi:hypothetical protein